jgi:hypothetical protein
LPRASVPVLLVPYAIIADNTMQLKMKQLSHL